MKYLTLFIVLIFLASCKEEEIPLIEYSQPNDEIIEILPENIDTGSIYPVIAEYYENLSIAAKWYAKHPAFVEETKIKTPLNYNPIIEKLKLIKIVAANGETISVFELDEKELNDFLECWKLIEAHDLSAKFRKSPGEEPLAVFKSRNQALDGKYNNNKSVSINDKDPYTLVREEIFKHAPQPEGNHNFSNIGDKEYSDEEFYENVKKHYNNAFSIVQGSPLQMPARTFIERIEPSIKKGRLLLALPGGWNTQSLIVFYPDKYWWDVGHISVMTHNSEELAYINDDSVSFTIGTSVDGTLPEKVVEKWLKKHCLAFVCQVYDVVWEKCQTINDEKISWKKIMTEADNEAILEETKKYKGVPYCGTLETFYSKYTAPESFICSSLVWYTVKQSTGIIVDDGWGSTVYPVDIFLSENVKIIDDTLD